MKMDAIGALIGVILLFLPVIIYMIRTKDYAVETWLMLGVGMLIGINIVGFTLWFILGKDKMWIGFVVIWIYGMFKALQKK